jgi:uncharacterized membrane protein YfcA
VSPTDALLCLAAGFTVAVVCTPVGISGAFLLVPFQASVLGAPLPAVGPTSLLFNVISSPGGVWRYARDRRIHPRLTRLVLTGSVPAICLGAWCHVHILTDARSFKLIAGLVLLALALRVALTHPTTHPYPAERPEPIVRAAPVIAAAAAVGFAGGLYGIGGGSLLAPLLVGTGIAVVDVAGVALVTTLVTSLVGLAAYTLLAATGSGTGPDWTLGLCLGLGGLAGSYVGARARHWLPAAALSPLIAALAAATGILYLAQTATT